MDAFEKDGEQEFDVYEVDVASLVDERRYFHFSSCQVVFSESSVQRFIIVSMKYELIHEMNALIATKHQKK